MAVFIDSSPEFLSEYRKATTHGFKIGGEFPWAPRINCQEAGEEARPGQHVCVAPKTLEEENVEEHWEQSTRQNSDGNTSKNAAHAFA